MKGILLGLFFTLFCLAGMAMADIAIETDTDMEIQPVGNVKVHQVQYIRDDRSYDETTTQMSGGMAAMTGNKEMKNVQIIRFDKGLGWVVDPSKKSYSEFTFDNMKEEIDRAQSQVQENVPMDDYTWTTDVNKDAGTETIMGFKCKGIRILSTGVKKDDPKDSIFITNEQWYSDDVPGGEKFTEYADKMAVSLGMEKGFMNQMSMNPMMAKFGEQFSEIAKEFESMEGIPLKTVLIVEGTVDPMAQAMGGQEIDDNTRAMMESMGMKMPEANPEGGHHSILKMTNTVSKIEKKSIEDGTYEIPEGYSKK